MDISRRHLIATASSLGLSTQLFPIFEAVAAGGGGAVRIRENIQTFASNPAKVAALRAAVKKMKERSAANPNDPLGWGYWAAVHGSNAPASPSEPRDPDGRPIYRQCKHFSNSFISWHRPFLFFFEAALKQGAADAGDTTSIELPYWNWYANPLIPAIFTQGDADSNPLFHDREVLDLTDVSLDRSALEQDNLLPGPGVPNSSAFSPLLEANPHGAVHDIVGGDMGFINRSARDPIFWLHHANIDRLWTAWMKGGTRVLPAADSAWAREKWFFDSAGDMTHSAGPMLDAEQTLKYKYDDEAMPAPAMIASRAAPRTIEAAPSVETATPRAGAAPSARTISATPEPITLGNDPVAVNLNVAPAEAGQLRSFAASPAAADIKSGSIVLEDVEIGPDGQAGGYSYSVVASLQHEGEAAPRRAVLGSLGTFSLSVAAQSAGHEHGEPIGKQTLSFPLADVLAALGAADAATLEKGLKITIEPAQPPKPGASPQNIKIGAIKINVSTAPPE